MYSCQLNKPAEYGHLNKLVDFPIAKDGIYYWHIANVSKDLDEFKIILAFEKAMNIWQRAMDIIEPVGTYVSFKSTSDISKAHFIFNFGVRKHSFKDSKNTQHVCPFDFDSEGGVLAHAWSYCTDQPYGGQLHLDDAENWSDMHGVDKFGTNHTHLLTVLLHEIGHILDLAHSDIREAMMYPQYTGIKQLHPDDYKGLEVKFGHIKRQLAGIENKQKSWFSRFIMKFFV